ncbi:wax ester/triacylglycerol synthase domain-containing protein [Mycobacterium servetii]|uniref:Wax ester/triacylglycerol synthase domain-containing protein n=1 Tax=Mycobacterium servetii TaxID=3237418 RepID=A0ABV4C6A3_9MYCO
MEQLTLAATLAERIRDVPRFRQRVHKHPFELAAPEWVDDNALTHTALGAAQFVTGLLTPAAGSSLHGSLAGMRRYSAARVSLKDVETVCHTFGVTLNDVALAAITDSFSHHAAAARQ